MSKSGTGIGYNRTVKLSWLNTVAGLAAAGKSDKEIYASLSDMLKDQLSPGSMAKRGSREKTITLLLKTWVRIPEDLQAFRDEGLELFRTLESENRMALQWGMTFAAYPFCKVVADLIGRFFRLQESAVASQIQRRARELLGERETVARSTRYVVRAFLEWGAFEEETRKGIYHPVRQIIIDNQRLASWLIESVLRANAGQPVSARMLIESPALFPFNLSQHNSHVLLDNGRFDISRRGLDVEMVKIR